MPVGMLNRPPLKVLIAAPRGFCAGVDRAIQIVELALERFGYDVHDGKKAVIAFQRRYRPELLDGVIDGECRAILLGLLLDPKSAAAT